MLFDESGERDRTAVMQAAQPCGARTDERFFRAVGLNYYAQLTAVLPGKAAGASGLEGFTLDGDYSILWAADILAWGFFLGLATLLLASVFGGAGVDTCLRWLLVANGVLSLASVIGYAASCAPRRPRPRFSRDSSVRMLPVTGV